MIYINTTKTGNQQVDSAVRTTFIFTARRYASAVYAAIMVSLYVCLSATSRYCVETTRRIELVLAWELFFDPC